MDEIVEMVVYVIVFVLFIIGCILWVTKSEPKKQNCYDRGGIVVEDWFGLYSDCILGKESEKNEKN